MTYEQFIEPETAELAKQAGFSWEVNAFYCYKGEEVSIAPAYYDFNKTIYYSAPTQSVLQRWLREVKNMWVAVECANAGDLQYSMYWAQLYDEEDGYYYTSYWDDDEKKECVEEYPTFEDALEAGLRQCLILLIEKHKTQNYENT